MNKRIEIVAHRGANERAPENSMAALKLCIDWGVDYLEVDVRRSRDGVLYNFHDPILGRTTGGFGLFSAHSSRKIDTLDMGSKFGREFRGERVPKIKDILEYCSGKIKIYFDVKDADLHLLVDLVRARRMEDSSFFWFADSKKALELKRIAPELTLKINADTADLVKKAAEEFDAGIIECGFHLLSDGMIAACREKGMKLMVRQGQEDREVFRRIVRSGADMVNLDQPDVFIEVLREESGEGSGKDD
jgi:glycerophosphoryl diester phosphodiesterase